ncbi:peroxiredoxin [Ectothiorhodospiraceae bacterium 2226]|nr:peroxiredoxin [Ectothiorhodospiraceae bacterium 2226]
MLENGQAAPEFELPDADMRLVPLTKFRGTKHVVLYFYPKDDTSGCTLEAIDFSNLIDDFDRLDTVVLGVSPDDPISHDAFREKHGLSVQLLSDADLEACTLYDVWREKEKDGVKRMGVLRSTFIIDKDGVVRHALYGVKAHGHAAQVLELVRGLDGA